MNKLKLKSYDEILQREKFSLDHHVTLTNFDSLISEIDLLKNEEGLTNCQIMKAHNNCNQHFMHGYLVLTSEGKEAILGRDCGDKYFELDERFAQQRNQLRAKIERDETITSLSKILEEIDQEKVEKIETDLKEIAEEVRKTMKAYPDLTKRRLEQREKSKNPTVSIDINYPETNENGKKMPRWISENIGNIEGTYIWQYQDNIGSLFNLLKEIKHTLQVAHINQGATTSQMKKWVKTLSAISEVISGLQKTTEAYKRFITPSNLYMTTLLTRNRTEREQIIRQEIGNNDKKFNASKYLSDLDKKLRSEFKNRDFKVAA